MKKTLLGFTIIAVILLVLVGARFVGNPTGGSPQLASLQAADKEVVVYKSATCGCCGQYVGYLQGQGLKVKVVDTSDMQPIKRQYGIPQNLESCHTTIAGNYYIEGHIPVEVVGKLLTEKPNIKGIALPGMPSATPGMPGPKLEEWNIRQIANDGTVTTYITM
jgi:hypothetical protein